MGVLTMIAAAAENNALGKDNDLVWHLPDDFKRFKQLTTGHHIIMGRKTFETFPKPLPNRTHIVITRKKDYQKEGAIVVNSLEEALELAKEDPQPFIIGGGEIYELALPEADKIELTRVHGTFEADAFFPEIDEENWELVSSSFHPAMRRTIIHLPISPTGVPNEREIIQKIAETEGFSLTGASPLSGGSINKVYRLDTSEGKKVLKVNTAGKFPGMFQAEEEGLRELRKSKTVDVPKVFSRGEIAGTAYLLMEYKAEAPQKPDFWSRLAADLAALHKTTQPKFGFHGPNYIGSLPQYNHHHDSAADFYIQERLEPQFRMALDAGYAFHGLEKIFQVFTEMIPKEAPALVHGDLWSGNYISNEQGLPCLIDPAVSYGPREMDLAMMKLFGGFPEEVFDQYDSLFPVEPGFKDRIEMWQLYYLLVHLNIFGSSYLGQVKNILTRFS